MSVVELAALVQPEIGGSGPSAQERAAGDLSALLAALSSVLAETLRRFEDLSGRVTDGILKRGQAIDHDLIIALQDFDRLQQEFAAIADVMTYCASVPPDAEIGAFPQQALARVNLADVKIRLRDHLRTRQGEGLAAPIDDAEQVF